jgi:hypothetical protein
MIPYSEMPPHTSPVEKKIRTPRNSGPGAALGRRVVGAVLLFGVGLLAASATIPYGADLYDEGLIANGAALALRGQLPGASFYAPYPPSAFWALALAFQCWGVRLLVERWLAAMLAALVGAVGFWMISQDDAGSKKAHGGELAAAWLAAFAATLLLGVRWVTPVNGGALLLVLVSGLPLLAALPGGRPAGAFFCGTIIGAAALWRLDFGLYAFTAGLCVWCLFAGWRAPGALVSRARLAGAALLVLGTVAVSAPPLGWVLIRGGHRAADSLFWWPITSTGTARLPWTRHWSAFLTPIAAALLVVRGAPLLRRSPARAAQVCWLLLVGAGFLTYALGRTHATHLLPLRVVSLLLVGLCLKRGSPDPATQGGEIRSAAATARALFSLEAVVLLTIVVSNAYGPARESLQARSAAAGRTVSLPGPRGAGVYPPRREAEGYCRLLGYLDRELPPGARLFSGAARHDLFLKDDNLAYFLSRREPGTYYWCLDAGVTSTLPVQEEMVRELEASRVQAVVVRTDCFNHERNSGSRSSGVRRLDQYLRTHFRLAAAWDHYRVYRPPQPLPLKSERQSSPRPPGAERGTSLRTGPRGNHGPSRPRAGGTI